MLTLHEGHRLVCQVLEPFRVDRPVAHHGRPGRDPASAVCGETGEALDATARQEPGCDLIRRSVRVELLSPGHGSPHLAWLRIQDLTTTDHELASSVTQDELVTDGERQGPVESHDRHRFFEHEQIDPVGSRSDVDCVCASGVEFAGEAGRMQARRESARQLPLGGEPDHVPSSHFVVIDPGEVDGDSPTRCHLVAGLLMTLQAPDAGLQPPGVDLHRLVDRERGSEETPRDDRARTGDGERPIDPETRPAVVPSLLWQQALEITQHGVDPLAGDSRDHVDRRRFER